MPDRLSKPGDMIIHHFLDKIKPFLKRKGNLRHSVFGIITLHVSSGKGYFNPCQTRRCMNPSELILKINRYSTHAGTQLGASHPLSNGAEFAQKIFAIQTMYYSSKNTVSYTFNKSV